MRLGAPFTRNYLKRTKIEIAQSFKVPCEQSENIELSRVNEVHGQILPPVENSFGAV